MNSEFLPRDKRACNLYSIMSFEQPPKAEKNLTEYSHALFLVKMAEENLAKNPELGAVEGALSKMTMTRDDHDRAFELIKNPDLRAKVEALEKTENKSAEYLEALRLVKIAEEQMEIRPELKTVEEAFGRLAMRPLDHDRGLELMKDQRLRAQVEAHEKRQEEIRKLFE